MILCPRNTCDVSSMLHSATPDRTLPVNRVNYPIIHRFAEVENSFGKYPEGARNNQSYSPPPYPPPFPATRRNLRPRETQVDYFALHNFGKQGQQAWTVFEGGGEDPGLSFKPGERRLEGEQDGARS